MSYCIHKDISEQALLLQYRIGDIVDELWNRKAEGLGFRPKERNASVVIFGVYRRRARRNSCTCFFLSTST